MKKPGTPVKEEPSAPNKRKSTGTDNPRHLRAIAALLHRPMAPKQLDTIAGASNVPDLVAELRRRGLDVPCRRISFIDRDGHCCRPGVYNLAPAARRLFWQWRAQPLRGGAV